MCTGPGALKACARARGSARAPAARHQHVVCPPRERAPRATTMHVRPPTPSHARAGALAVVEQLRGEVGEAQAQAERHRAATGHLKEQMREVLVARDAMEQELLAERQYNLELAQIVSQLRQGGRV